MAKSNNIIGIDIQKSYFCVVQLDSSDIAVRQAAVQPLPNVDAGDFWDSVAYELKDICKKVRLTGTAIVCSLPCDMVVVRALEAQSDESDQNDVLRFELEAGLLGSIGEYVYDFYEVDPGDQVERRKYVAAAARKEMLNKLKKAMKGVKLTPDIVDVDIFALTTVFQTNYRDRLSEASILVHGEPIGTKMILVHNSSYIDYGVFEFDAAHRGAAEYVAALNEELTRLASRNAELAQNGANVFLAGSLFASEQFSTAACGGIPKCEMLDPFKTVTCAAGMDSGQIKTYSPRLAVAIGLALRGDE